MMAVGVELMAGRHIDAVREIDLLVYPNPWSAATWRRELAGPDRDHRVAVVDGRIVGHAGILHVIDEVHITTVAVDPDAESRGIATRLLLALLHAARAHGSTAATLEVRAADRRPQRLYGRFGFRPAGVRRAYYSNPRDDAIVMWLHDLQGDEVAERWRSIDEASDATRRAPCHKM